MKLLVVGSKGQIGSAIVEVLSDTYEVSGVDIGTPTPSQSFDIMHVAIPYSQDFVETVTRYEDQYQPGAVVIHSTVPVGTCDPHGWTHAPIRGRHPNLTPGILTFPLHIAGRDALEAERVFSACGITTITHDQAATTEAGKLWELAQLGIQVRVSHEIHDYCQQHGLDYSEVYTMFAETYNTGYSQLEPQFVRPVLEYMPGPLGGHCVAQNSPLLYSEFVDRLLSPITP